MCEENPAGFDVAVSDGNEELEADVWICFLSIFFPIFAINLDRKKNLEKS